MLSAIVWKDSGEWYVQVSDGRRITLPGWLTRTQIYAACKKLGVEPEHVSFTE